MCGIFGIVNTDPARLVDPSEVRRATDTIAHRGPDDTGIWTAEGVGLGHRRLAILDLSPRGHQPMDSHDKSCVIVFNGEIYNFRELRPALEAKGHRFDSECDTEVLLALYQEHGEDMVKFLRGMFAFAIWDRARRRLFAARDRFGKKPFKYFHDGRRFVFASELKAILADPTVPRVPDESDIMRYLSLQFVSSPGTGFRGIHKLPPAHCLTWQDGNVTTRRYWELDYTRKESRSEKEWCEAILAKFDEAVQLRLVSDVPLGAFLSGGIDSSAVVARMAKLSPGRVKTFSIAFEEKTHDESAYARQIAEQFGTEHTQFTVRYDLLDVFPKLVWHYEEPYADSSALPSYYLARETRSQVTVALTGDAGDENFGGYSRYAYLAILDYLDLAPPIVRTKVLAPFFKLAAPLFRSDLRRRLGMLAEIAKMSRAERYADMFSYFTRAQIARVTTAEFRRVANCDPYEPLLSAHARPNARAKMERIYNTDQQLYLPDCLNAKVDIASMANSLECRAPFQDHELAQLVASAPANLKLNGREKKYLLKKTFAGILPNDILYRPKQGFGVPIDHWFRGPLRQWATDTLLSQRFLSRGVVSREGAEWVLDNHLKRGMNYSYQIWALLTLANWYEQFMDTPANTP